MEDAGVETMEVDAAECGVHSSAVLMWIEGAVVPMTAVASLAATGEAEIHDGVM